MLFDPGIVAKIENRFAVGMDQFLHIVRRGTQQVPSINLSRHQGVEGVHTEVLLGFLRAAISILGAFDSIAANGW